MASLFHHILVPVDFTDNNRAAIQVAKNIASQNHARVTLLHVIETIEYLEDEEVLGFYDQLEAKARIQLENLAKLFASDNIDVQHKIILDKRVRGIVKFALERNADLVVLSSHRVKLDEGLTGLGTVSHHVSILCQCPVLLVK